MQIKCFKLECCPCPNDKVFFIMLRIISVPQAYSWLYVLDYICTCRKNQNLAHFLLNKFSFISLDSMSLWQKSHWQKIQKCWKLKTTISFAKTVLKGFFILLSGYFFISQCFWHRTSALKAFLNGPLSLGKDNSTTEKVFS